MSWEDGLADIPVRIPEPVLAAARYAVEHGAEVWFWHRSGVPDLGRNGTWIYVEALSFEPDAELALSLGGFVKTGFGGHWVSKDGQRKMVWTWTDARSTVPP